MRFLLRPLVFLLPLCFHSSFVSAKAINALDALADIDTWANKPKLADHRVQVTMGLSELRKALKELETATKTAIDPSNPEGEELGKLFKEMKDAGAKIKDSIEKIGLNILEGKAPNAGNNPQGNIATLVTTIMSNSDRFFELLKKTSASLPEETIEKFKSSLKQVIENGKGVLDVQGKTVQEVINVKNPPPATSAKKEPAPSTEDENKRL